MKYQIQRLALIAGLSFYSVTSAFADDEDSSEADSSAHHRQNKQYIVVGELFGVATGLTGGSQGVNGGKYLDPDSILEASFAYTNGKGQDYSNSSKITDGGIEYRTKYVGRATNLAVRYKRFFANSFYGYGGPSYRNTQATMSVQTTAANILTVESDVAEVKMSDLGLDGAIGNAWQWENFTIGCDWFGLHIPVARIKNDYDDKNVTITNSDLKKARESFVTQARGPSIMALRFYLGASF